MTQSTRIFAALFHRKGFAVLILLVLACAIVELVLIGADNGLWGSSRWRSLAYANGAFWVGLLHGWQPNYDHQEWAMFVTYSLLHAGLGHLLTNMAALIWLGYSIITRVGQAAFSLLYVLSLLGGAIGFALLTSKLQPMVGASGALFGLLGAQIVWDFITANRDEVSPSKLTGQVMISIAILIGLNVVMYWTNNGNLAWEAHFGGAVAGAVLAPFLLPAREIPTEKGPD